MRTGTLLLPAILLSVACAHNVPLTQKSDLSKSSGPAKKNSPPPVATTNPENPTSPFKTALEEEIFWKLVNGEVQIEAKENEMPLVFNLAMIMHMALSSTVQLGTRAEALEILLRSAVLGFDPEQNRVLDEAFLSNDPEQRWQAVQQLFEMNKRTLAIINYALGNEARMKEFVAKQRNAAPNQPDDDLPAPSEQKQNQDVKPSQSF